MKNKGYEKFGAGGGGGGGIWCIMGNVEVAYIINKLPPIVRFKSQIQL